MSISLIAAIRKQTQVSITKAKEALLKSNGDLTKALEWIEQDISSSSLKKAEKVQSRVTAEGLIALSVDPLGNRAGLIELLSETDFVSRSQDFGDLCTRISNTHLLLNHENNLEFLKMAPLLPLNSSSLNSSDAIKTVQESILEKMVKLGENIQLRRIEMLSEAEESGVVNGYVHSVDSKHGLGRIGGLVSLKSRTILEPDQRQEILLFAKKLAQHIVGFNPMSIRSQEGVEGDSVLMNQSFLMGGGTISQVLENEASRLKLQGIEIMNFKRMECGEGIEKTQDDFAKQVQEMM
jgi:elongation factor Ts